METLKLNSVLAKLSNVKVETGREELIHEGQVLVLEKAARARNAALKGANRPTEDFGSNFKSNSDYEAYCQKWSEDVLYYAASKANSFYDKPTDRNNRATYMNRELMSNGIFLHTLAQTWNEVLRPVTPALVSDIVGEMCSVVTTPIGQTYEVAIQSNAVIAWEDTTWTSLRSVPQDKLYGESITINPKPKAARAVINLYQMLGNGQNMVDTLAAIAGGYAAMVMKKFTDAFTAAAANTRYLPSVLKAQGYTDLNWATLCQNVAKANRVRRTDLIAYGNFLALRKILPDNATLAPSIMMQLGNEYFRNGYLMSHDGVMVYEIQPTSSPETINTTLTDVFPTNEIIIAARASERYAPMICCFEEGGDMQIDLTPAEGAVATGRIEVLQTACFEIAPVFASRIGVIENIV